MGLVIVAAAGSMLASTGAFSGTGAAETFAGWFEVAAGSFMLLLAARQWRRAPSVGGPRAPAWMATLDSVRPRSALGLAALLSGVNPKNLVLTLGAALLIGRAAVGTGAQVALLVAFIVVASLTVAVPVVYVLIDPDRATAVLLRWKGWVALNGRAAGLGALLVLGSLIAFKGIWDISQG